MDKKAFTVMGVSFEWVIIIIVIIFGTIAIIVYLNYILSGSNWLPLQ